MRFANLRGRSHLAVGPDQYVDLAHASRGTLPAEPMRCLEQWDAVRSWCERASWTPEQIITAAASELDAPVPTPRQIFAVGLNYAEHALETRLHGNADAPLTFTKFPTAVTGPVGDLHLPTDTVDWEVELVAVVGRYTHHVAEEQAWEALAGLTLGQDLSERTGQMRGEPPQFSLAKSYPGFAPLGPHLVSLDEIEDRDDLHLECRVNDTVVQTGSTRQLIHSIPRLISFYSAICPLLPGDLIFTGTPAGVGMGRDPQTYLREGDLLVSSSPQIGELRQHCRRTVAHEELADA